MKGGLKQGFSTIEAVVAVAFGLVISVLTFSKISGHQKVQKHLQTLSEKLLVREAIAKKIDCQKTRNANIANPGSVFDPKTACSDKITLDSTASDQWQESQGYFYQLKDAYGEDLAFYPGQSRAGFLGVYQVRTSCSQAYSGLPFTANLVLFAKPVTAEGKARINPLTKKPYKPFNLFPEGLCPVNFPPPPAPPIASGPSSAPPSGSPGSGTPPSPSSTPAAAGRSAPGSSAPGSGGGSTPTLASNSPAPANGGCGGNPTTPGSSNSSSTTGNKSAGAGASSAAGSQTSTSASSTPTSTDTCASLQRADGSSVQATSSTSGGPDSNVKNTTTVKENASGGVSVKQTATSSGR